VNSAVTVTAGVGMSGGGAVSLGGSVTLNNAGVTSTVAGTDITVSAATGTVTIGTNSTLATVTGRGATTATAISLTNTTTSTSTTTGALTVSGGVGIAGNINVGGLINSTSTNTLQTSSNFGTYAGGNYYIRLGNTGTYTPGIFINNSNQNVSIGTESDPGYKLGVNGSFTSTSAYISNTTASTNSATGALIVNGGAGVQGHIYTGGNLYGTNGRGSLRDNSFENAYTASNSNVAINFVGYQGSNSYYRDLNIYDGKSTQLFAFYSGASGSYNISNQQLRVTSSTLTVATQGTYALTVGNANATDFCVGSDSSYVYLQSFNSKSLYINNQGNNIYFNGTIYDGANTSYYLKPSSASVLSRLNITTPGNAGAIAVSGNTTSNILGDVNITRSGTPSLSIGQGAGVQLNNSSNNDAAMIQIGTSAAIQFWQSTTTLGWTESLRIDANRNLIVTNSVYASGTYYDNANTAYYVKPSSLTNLSSLTTNSTTTIVNTGGANYNESMRLPRANDGYVCLAMACDTTGSGSISGQFNQIVYPAATSGLGGAGCYSIRANSTDVFALSTAGNMYASGNFYATGDVYSSYSDIRLKNIVGYIEDPIAMLKQIDTFYYEPNESAVALGATPGRRVGVSAQSVNTVLPEVIGQSTLGEGYMTVQYERLVPLLIESMKKQQEQIEKLTAQVNELQSKLIGD
jgi:hypothetical protein